MSNDITQILEKYKNEIKKIEESDLSELSNVAHGVQLSRTYIHTLRVKIREVDFSSNELEIIFFKEQKPYIYGRLKFYVKLYKYLLQKPSGSIKIQRKYIDDVISKLDYHNTKNLDFLRYYSLAETHLDKYYFLRGNDNLTLISDTSHYYTDPEFSTSHDIVVAQIIAYQLLTAFYNSELELLRRKENNLISEDDYSIINENLSWTGTKTDLVELIYALQSSGVIRNGHTDIKKIAFVCEKLFEIDLGNFYRTYLEIRERKMDRTRFINLLKTSLEKRMKDDDEKY